MLCIFLWSLLAANVFGGGPSLFIAFFAAEFAAAVLGGFFLHSLLFSALYKLRLPYEATLSVIAYAAIVKLVAWFPLLAVFADIFGLYLMYQGFKWVHRLTPPRAGLAVCLTMMTIGIIKSVILMLAVPEWLNSVLKAVEQAGSLPS
jgi:hypothetical protein